MRIKSSHRWEKIDYVEYKNNIYEVYKNINVYISTYGEVKKIFSNGKEKITKGYGKRYKRVTITCIDSNGEKIKLEILIHRLVACSFLTKKDCDVDVNHKDGNPSNNRVTNLEWVTHKENVIHGLESGLTPSSYSKDTIEYISKLLIEGFSDSEISKKMNSLGIISSPDRIFRIRNKENYSRYTEKYTFPKNKPHKKRDPLLAKNIFNLINKGYSNKEIIEELNLMRFFKKKSTVTSYLYKFRHNQIWNTIN